MLFNLALTVQIVSTSHGKMLTRSMTSQLTPSCSLARSATCCSTCTWVPQPTSVTSLPGRTSHAMVTRAIGVMYTACNMGNPGSGSTKRLVLIDYLLGRCPPCPGGGRSRPRAPLPRRPGTAPWAPGTGRGPGP